MTLIYNSDHPTTAGLYDPMVTYILANDLIFCRHAWVEDLSIVKFYNKLKNNDLNFKLTSAQCTTWAGDDHAANFKVTGTLEDCAFLLRTTTSPELFVWGKNLVAAEKALESLLSWLPQDINSATDAVSFEFWRFSRGTAMASKRNLRCPAFAELKDNYDIQVQDKVSRLINLSSPEKHGRIILWHGPPGTGKTHMIRALARETKGKLSPEIILDPNELFANPDYFYSLLMEDGDEFEENLPDDKIDKTRLLIIEDHSELFTKEGGCRLNAGFSRLLNITDGLLGQGQKLIFLLTSNEPIEAIDEALLRSGRCLQNLEFPALSITQANEWFRKKNVSDFVTDNTCLSDLYAILNNKPTASEITSDNKSDFGFKK